MVVIDDTIDGGGVTWSTVVVSVGEGKEMEEREENDDLALRCSDKA